MRRQRTSEALGNLAVALILLMVAAQAFRWLGSPPAGASTIRYSFVVVELILGFGIALGIVLLTIVRYRRGAREQGHRSPA